VSQLRNARARARLLVSAAAAVAAVAAGLAVWLPGHGDPTAAARPAPPAPAPAAPGTIMTVAGGAGDGTGSGPGQPPISNAVPATRTSIFPYGATVAAAGNLLMATDNRVRVVARRTGRFYGMRMTAGYIYTVAGPFPGAHDVAVDRHGNILVLDASANVVRLVAEASGTFYGQHVTAGHDYVIAGHAHGRAGLGGNGPATKAWLDGPDAIAVAPDGRLLIAESGGQRIQAVMP
jgi:hypothetical protein